MERHRTSCHGLGEGFRISGREVRVAVASGSPNYGQPLVGPGVFWSQAPKGDEGMTVPIRRCAVYTRKSSEEGLEQSFNSLHAQREACEAYIRSQAHEGWKLVKTPYDDGGFSGGTMERPAVKRLTADLKQGLVDVVVVYKVDRLTRSLADFAKIVEILEGHGASFVSITQQFNTTSPYTESNRVCDGPQGKALRWATACVEAHRQARQIQELYT